MSLAKRVVLSYSTREMIKKQYGKVIRDGLKSSCNKDSILYNGNSNSNSKLNQWKPIKHPKK